MFTNKWICYASQNQGDYIHVIIYIWKIFVALTCSMATFNDSSKKKKRNGTRTERQIYIYIIYNGTTRKKKRNKQETDYNKILVGARTRDRKKKTKEEMIIINKFET